MPFLLIRGAVGYSLTLGRRPILVLDPTAKLQATDLFAGIGGYDAAWSGTNRHKELQKMIVKVSEVIALFVGPRLPRTWGLSVL